MQRFKGQTLTEYVLVGTLMLMISIGALTLLGGKISKVLGLILPGAPQPAVASTAINPASSSAISAGVSKTGLTTAPFGGSLPRPVTRQTLPKSSADLIMTSPSTLRQVEGRA